MNVTPTPRRQRGLTLAEACCVLAITAILLTIGVPTLRDVLDARRLEGIANQLASDIQFARTEAVARNEPLRLSLHPAPGGSCYVIHTGPADHCSCNADGPARCLAGAQSMRTVVLATVDRVALQANVASMLFDPLQGTASPASTLRVIGTRDRAIYQVVNILGRVRSCSPRAAVPGYRAC
jgi:type IV fimbrial biogenesis protein FimT